MQKVCGERAKYVRAESKNMVREGKNDEPREHSDAGRGKIVARKTQKSARANGVLEARI